MKVLQFDYEMQLTFSEPAYKHHYTLKCLPVSDEMQQLENCRLDVFPHNCLSYGGDSFGNRIIYGEIVSRHDRFLVKLSGQAKTGLKKGRIMDWNAVNVYAYPSAYTKTGKLLKAYEKQIYPVIPIQTFALAELFMHRIYQDMTYEPGVTTIATTAEEAFLLRKGVCQDYAHIMLALLRLNHIPCRYVVGMMCGEGQSHAWVEVGCDGIWYGFDPTNDRLVDDTYLYLSSGRDYLDCEMNRGVFTGGGKQVQRVAAVVSVIG